MKKLSLWLTLCLVAFAAAAQEPIKVRKLEEKMLAWAVLEARGTPQTMERTLQTALETQMQTAPAMLPFRDAFEGFLRETSSYQALREELAEIYLEAYTLNELRELIRFYQTPLGRKMAAADAKIGSAVTTLTQQKMQESYPRFQQRIIMKMQEQQRQAAEPPPASPETTPAPTTKSTETKEK